MKLFLLGPFRAERRGKPLTAFKSVKVRALLAYLAVEKETSHHRDVLAGLLWPQSSGALALLRDALSNLRLTLGDRDAATPVVRVDGDTLQLNPSALRQDTLWLDVAAFSEAVEKASTEVDLERTVALYRGQLLEGLSVADSPDFEAWLLLRREIVQRKFLDALYHLTTLYLQNGSYTDAQVSARRQLTLDPYSEEANRQLMRALVFAGQRNRALSHYLDYRTMLEAELSVAPDARTTALYQRIRDRRLRPKTLRAPITPSPFSSETSSTACVGRDSELTWLENRLRQVERGMGHVVFISGAAGSGKTTLMRAFARRILGGTEDLVFAQGTCNAQVGAGDPYLPFSEILRLSTGDLATPPVGGTLTPAYAQRLESFAPTFTQVLTEEGPDLIGRLVPVPAQSLDRQARETSAAPHTSLPPAAICDQVTRVLRAAATQRLLVLVLEDLQWADSGTLNLLAHLGRRLADSRILLIGVYRSTDLDPDHALLSVVRELQAAHGDIILDLDHAGGRAFVDALLDSMPNALDEAFRARLTQQTGGHALFTTALVQHMCAGGALIQDDEGLWRAGADLDWSQMPPRVEAVIAERLAGLTEEQRELLTVAGVEGEVFTIEVAAQVLDRKPEDVEGELQRLGDSTRYGAHQHLIHNLGLERVEDGRAPVSRRFARYRFRHELFQHYLYEQLGPVQRRRLHEAVGQVLESLYAGRLDTVAGRLAYHFEAAGLIKPAVDYLLRAGRRAYRLSAPAESTALYRRALDLLPALPASRRRDRREMDILLALEEALMTARGWGAPERAASLQRAYRLGRRLGETEHMLRVLRALVSVHIARAEHNTALNYARQLLTLAQETSNGLYAGIGERMLGTVQFFLGSCAQACKHLEAGLRAYATFTPGHASERALAAEEEVRLRVWLSYALLVRGYPAQAAAIGREALSKAAALDYVGVQGIALTTAGAVFHAAYRRPQATCQYAGQLLDLAQKHTLPSYQGWGRFYRGWARARQGHPEQGLTEMRAGLEQLQSTGTQGSIPMLLTLLAETYAQTGAIQAGKTTIDRALVLAEETDARSYLAEMHRVRGLLHLREQATNEAEASFEHAIDIAQSQAARLWELRATMDLCRLQGSKGQVERARSRLAELYDWFSEGFDLPDLQEADALLDALTDAHVEDCEGR